MTSQGVGEVVAFCAKCGSNTSHQAASDLRIHCLRCVGDDIPGITSPPPPVPTAAPIVWNNSPDPRPQVVHVHHRKQRDGIVIGTIKLAGFIVALIILASVGMCVYVCGSVANPSERSRSSMESPSSMPSPAVVAESVQRQREVSPAIERMDAEVFPGDSINLKFVPMYEVRVIAKECNEAMLEEAIAKMTPARLARLNITIASCKRGGADEVNVFVPKD